MKTILIDIKSYLKENNINFKTTSHPPVFTVEESKRLRLHEKIKGMHTKNLFLKDRKSKDFYLVILQADKKLDIENLGKMLGKRVKFANADDLKNLLGVHPGSVSPFGLINDKEHKVKVLINKNVWDADTVSFHPNINTETLELTKEGFHKFIKSLKNTFDII